MKNKIAILENKELSDWIFEYHYQHYRYGFIAYAFIHLSYLLLDNLYYPQFWDCSLIVRLGIAMPVLMLPVVLSFTGFYKKYFLIVNTLAATIVPITLLLLIFIISDSGSELSTVYYAGLIIQVMVMGLFIYSWKTALFSTGLVVLVYFLGGNFIFHFHSRDFFYEELLLVTSAAIISTLISYYYLAIKEKIIVSEKAIRLEKQLMEQKNIELGKTNKLKNKLLSIIAHDLRAPFGAFLGLSQAMADEPDTLSPEEISRYSSLINKSANNLYKLIDNLLEWSMLQTGELNFKPEIYRVSEIIAHNTEIFSSAAKQKNILLKANISDALIKADYNMISSVIRNLISNAIKYSGRGSEIKIDVSSLPAEQAVEVSVIDNGIGIESHELDRIFEIDSSVHANGTEGEPSTGLGLVLCKEFVEKHGGRIWAESEKGKGSTFHFTVPAAEAN